MATVCDPSDALGAEGGGIREASAGFLRSVPRRPVDSHQSGILRGLAHAHLQNDQRHVNDLRRWHVYYQAATRAYVRGELKRVFFCGKGLDSSFIFGG